MALVLEEVKKALEELLPGVALTAEGASLVVAPNDLTAVCRCLKDTERFACDYLASLTAVDYPPDRIEVVYHLYSMAKKHGPVALKVKVPRDPAACRVASVTPVWRSAEFQEREVYDLYGVTFEGHPDLRRILMWDEFEGYPMRKDFAQEDQNATEPGHPPEGGSAKEVPRPAGGRPTEPGHPPEAGRRGNPAAAGGGTPERVANDE